MEVRKMKRQKLNIGDKIYFALGFTNPIDVKRELVKLSKQGLLRGVKVEDYREVYDYLETRRRKNIELHESTNKLSMSEIKQMKENFVKALSTAIDNKQFGHYGELQVSEQIKYDILKWLNIRARDGFREITDFDRKNRGYFIVFNILLLDHERKLAILQGFQYLQWRSKEFSTMRKNYYIVGLTEENRTFTHFITGQLAWKLQSLWKNNDKDWFKQFLKWAFNLKDDKIADSLILQGDVAVYPCKRPKGQHVSKEIIEINKSHYIKGDLVDYGNNVFEVRNNIAYLVHARQQHNTKIIQPGVYAFAVMREAKFWDFSGQIKD